MHAKATDHAWTEQLKKAANQNLVWIDLEMTGLDLEKERILEIASIVTDDDLNILAEGPVLCVKQSQSLLDAMDEWNTQHHTESGLLDRVRSEGVSEETAEALTLEFVSGFVDQGKSPLCGNSIGQDRRFLRKYMPTLDDYFHYRSIDVSTIKELAARWRPDILEQVKKVNNHRALDDIRESIEELRLYRRQFFKLS